METNDFITHLRDQYTAAQPTSTGRQESYNNMLVDTRGNWVIVEIEGDRACLGLTVSDVKRLIEQLSDWIGEPDSPCDSCELSDGCITQPFTSECREYRLTHIMRGPWKRRSRGNIGRQEIGIEETLTITERKCVQSAKAIT